MTSLSNERLNGEVAYTFWIAMARLVHTKGGPLLPALLPSLEHENGPKMRVPLSLTCDERLPEMRHHPDVEDALLFKF